LTNLHTLDLSDNKLMTIPKEIWKLTDLYKLDLSNNQLTSIPKEIINLIDLWDINLDNNILVNLIGKEWSNYWMNDKTKWNIRIEYNDSTRRYELTVID